MFELDPSASTTLNVNDVTAMSGFELFPAFPNPAVDETRMHLRLDRAAEVTFELRDITGKLVEVRELGTQPAGYSSFMVNNSGVERRFIHRHIERGQRSHHSEVDGEVRFFSGRNLRLCIKGRPKPPFVVPSNGEMTSDIGSGA